MESATILMPPSTSLSGILLSAENSIFPKDQNIKTINTISMFGEKFYQLHVAQRQLLRPLPNEVKKGFNLRTTVDILSQNEKKRISRDPFPPQFDKSSSL